MHIAAKRCALSIALALTSASVQAADWIVRDLGTLGGTVSWANGISASGQVVGVSTTASYEVQHAFISAPNGGALTGLGTLGGVQSVANGINVSGQVVGWAGTVGGAQRAFISAPNGGALTDLGTLGGPESRATGVNASGQVVGYATTAGNVGHAFISPNGGAMLDLSTLAVAGRTLVIAYAVNDYSQVVGLDSRNHAFVATPNAKWGEAGNGSWDSAANWNFGGMGAIGVAPGAPHEVVINPSRSATVLGGANATVASLLVAGNKRQIVTLNLNKGSITALGGTTIDSYAVLTGSGQLNGALSVSPGGRVDVGAGENMQLSSGVVNNGELRVAAGGAANFFGLVSGAGSFTGAGAARFDGDLSPGNSPGLLQIDYAATFATSSRITMELGGTTPDSGHDKIVFTNSVTLEYGDLDVVWWGGWTGNAGDVYDLFDWNGPLTGTFGNVNLATLSDGLWWDTSALYTSGDLLVMAAVPEPEAYTTLLAGLGLLGFAARRRKQKTA